jgi:MFS family permease
MTGRTVVAAVLGNALEFFDFTVYSAYAVMIGRAFFPSSDSFTRLLLSVATFGVGFISRPLGGFVLGAYADRRGRKPALTLTIGLMAFGSVMIAVLPGFATIGYAAPALLVVARLLQGFSTGGELGAATAYMIEAAPAARGGFYGSWQIASQNLGVVTGGVIGVLLALLLTPGQLGAWGWRIPFLAGIVIAPVGLYIRANMRETLEPRAEESTGDVLRNLGRHSGTVVLAIGLISGATIAQYFFGYMTTFALTELHLPETTAMAATLVVGISGAVFAVVGGVLSDRFGAGAVVIWPRIVLTVLLYPAMWLVVSHPGAVVFLGVIAVLMAFQAVSSAVGVLLIPRAFPAHVRTTGLAVAYALGVTIFGGTAQVVVTWLIGTTGDKLSPAIYVVAMNVVSVVATVVLLRRQVDAPSPVRSL